MAISASYCRNCGRALSDAEKANPGTIVCSSCAPAAQPAADTTSPAGDSFTASPPVYTASSSSRVPPPPPPGSPSPGLAFVLGLIPGVGAIYNGQYVKGLVHAFIFGLLLTLNNASHHGHDDASPVLVLLTVAWIPYMAFEAYHTARRRAEGVMVDEFSSVVPLKAGTLVGPAALIGIGVLFLLNNLDLLRISQVVRFWPVGLIALGVYLLYVRMSESPTPPPTSEASHERNN